MMTHEEWLAGTADYTAADHAEVSHDLLDSAYANGMNPELAMFIRWHLDAERAAS